mmetsp:Transcript_37571/g.42311  ORF Transcript_37571/g.42311 Transcript_37571/m.42311 type:complete len:252 (+) Transcript_37571:62-817(+)
MKLCSALMLLLCQQHFCVVVVDADAGSPIVCPENYAPVWCEGNKYSNSCYAKAAGFIEKTQCTDGDVICSTDDTPVWCQGKVNVKQRKYYNQCFATAVGFAESQCTDKDPTTPIVCPKVIDPVFCEGIKYDNLCFAEAAGFMKSQCSPSDIFCPAVGNPVWCQGIRFSNSCFARAAGFLDESQCTDKCEDDETFQKGRKDKNCTAFLRKNGELRANAEKRCNKKHKGTKKVYDFCMKTCNEVGLGDCGVSL